MIFIILYLVQIISVSSFHSKVSFKNLNVLLKSSLHSLQMAYDETESFKYKSVAISGLISKKYDFCNPFVFSNIFEKNVIGSIKAFTDDVKFARKRMISPKTVYSGLFDILQFYQIENENMDTYKEALKDCEAWVAFNVSMSNINDLATCAANLNLKRVVFAVRMETEFEQGENYLLDETVLILKNAGIDYTLFKYIGDELTTRAEAQFPYRIVRDKLPLPKASAQNMFQTLSTDDLLRVITEVVDIPKTFNNVYGIGPGTSLDQEISIYMKSRGWPERVQVGLLVGDMMEKLEKKVNDENSKDKTVPVIQLDPSVAEEEKLALPQEGKGNKYAGFFA